MLQRSPSYVYNRPSRDRLFILLRKLLPAKIVNSIMRFKYVCFQQFSYAISKRWPAAVKKVLLNSIRKAANDTVDVDKHFSPSYDPWDQRVCMVPDNDMFEAVKNNKVNVVTQHIERFTENGILLKNGDEIKADLIVTATGLDLQLWGGMELLVDNIPVVTNSLTNYKGMMFSDIPNMVYIFGYTNASWTLKAELTYDYVCRLLDFMAQKGYKTVYPHTNSETESIGIVGLNSGYFLRAMDWLPKQGLDFPWRNKDFYFADLFAIKHSRLDDGVLMFDNTSTLADFHNQANKNEANKSQANQQKQNLSQVA
jgi:cation diffusion facilitator CzcD-associated flavoprotein CzcO